MTSSTLFVHLWLATWMEMHDIELWGMADLLNFSTPKDPNGRSFPFALSWVIPMNPKIMAGIQKGPNQAYADEYARVNTRISTLSKKLVKEIRQRGFRAQALAVSDRTDTVSIQGDFPHKTAATRAGLGWVGRNCQLITRKYGPWVRLGTVFTNMELSLGPPMTRSFCGECVRCVDACPANALKGNIWYPGIPREELLDVAACDQWKKDHYAEFHQGHNCGICSAVCPYGLKIFKRKGGK